MILIAAYLPAAYAAGVRGARSTVEELRPFLSAGSRRLATRRLPRDASIRSRLRRAGLIGHRILRADPALDRPYARRLGGLELHGRAGLPALLLPVGVGWFAGRFIYSVWAESRRLSAIGREHLRVDLLDLRAFAPLTRQGLRHALLVVGVISILALYLYDSDKRGLSRSCWRERRGARRRRSRAAPPAARRAPGDRRREAPRTRLVRRRICDARARRWRADPPAPGAIGDLVAWRGTVAAVPEWPLDAPTLRRFVLYLALPLGSWLGGAFVERVVDVVLR